MLRTYKFVVQAVIQEVDEEGVVLGERATEPVELFGHERLGEWAKKFPVELAKLNGAPSPADRKTPQKRERT